MISQLRGSQDTRSKSHQSSGTNWTCIWRSVICCYCFVPYTDNRDRYNRSIARNWRKNTNICILRQDAYSVGISILKKKNGSCPSCFHRVRLSSCIPARDSHPNKRQSWRNSLSPPRYYQLRTCKLCQGLEIPSRDISCFLNRYQVYIHHFSQSLHPKFSLWRPIDWRWPCPARLHFVSIYYDCGRVSTPLYSPSPLQTLPRHVHMHENMFQVSWLDVGSPSSSYLHTRPSSSPGQAV